MPLRRTPSFLIAFLVLAAQPALAQDAGDQYTRSNGVRDRFYVQVGAFYPAHDTFVRLQPADVPPIPGVDLEVDTSMPEHTAAFRIEGYVRLGRRHRVRLGWYTMNRSITHRLTGQIEWGDEVFPVDATIGAKWNSRVIKVDYRYSILLRDRIDVGVALGLFALKTETGIGLAATDDAFVTDTSQTAPLPMLGVDVEWIVADDWLFRGGGQLFGISIDDTVDGSWSEVKLAVEWYAKKTFGIGLGYNLNDVDIEIRLAEADISEFDYKYNFNGPYLYGFVSF